MVNRNEGKWSVYRHTSPSGKVYVGITSKRVQDRWRHGSGYTTSICFMRAIEKYGWDNIKHEVLFTGLSSERAKKLEIELISHYKRLGISYNLTDGGQGWLGHHHSEESKRKMRLAKLGRSLSDETKRKMSEARKGRPGISRAWTQEEKDRASRRRKGQKTQYHISKEELSRRFKAAQEGATSVPVLQYTRDGCFVAKYASGSEAGRAVGIKASHIFECCAGKVKTAKGFIWRRAI